MKKSFINFWRRNLAFSELAVTTNLEYRFNFFLDAFLQPIITVGIEILLWISIFAYATSDTIGGFHKEAYLAYAIWAPFLGRITISWMYEAMMVEEIGQGNINIILTRPISFYEYYLSQLMGYKLITTFLSLLIPVGISYYYKLPVIYDRLPFAILLVSYYLLLVHTMSFIVSSLAFYVTKVKSITLVKNLCLWLLAGEILPLDLMPKALYDLLMFLPFSAGVYIPASYITGRVGVEQIYHGFYSVTVSLVVLSLVARLIWKAGLRTYTGTGA